MLILKTGVTMELIDKIKINPNWTISLSKEIRKALNASKGDFLNFIKKDGEISVKLTSLDEEKEALSK